jgi:hypothetical protein|nr:MAG TPA: hypothetical protein [Bacteriophage sp.]
MNNIDNPLSEYQPPSKEALRNFGRLPQSHIEMTSARDSKIIEETRKFIRNENNKL